MISKDKINLQLSIKKEDLKRLEQLTEKLSKRFCISLTKSQAITFLINFYLQQSENQEKPKEEPIKKQASKPIIKEQKNNGLLPINSQYMRNESKRKILLLEKTLKVSHKELSDLLKINFETLRKYAQGKRLPTGENAVKIEEMYRKYGIF